PEDVQAGLEAQLARGVASRHIEYTRSDGSTWTLSLADIVERAKGLEMAYNPNDCIETRLAAPADGKGAATCRRPAPGEQGGSMQHYREWFSERRRPPR